MPRPSPIDVYVEVGARRTFAGALEWPGWCRSGRDEAGALAALLDYAPRYGRAVRTAQLGYEAPIAVSAFKVAQRLKGNATTDFGAPGGVPRADTTPVGEPDLVRMTALLKASWKAFDQAAQRASGLPLRKGPRGGGRTLAAITRHAEEAEAAYLGKMGFKSPAAGQGPIAARKHILECLATAVRDGVPARGPRGGVRWSPRTFVRRDTWHWLDHAWEIEDRTQRDLRRHA
jgi:hypothetical protein